MKSSLRFATLTGIAAVALLAGCGKQDKKADAAPEDPAVSGALGDQIMVDPNMGGQNGAAVSAEGAAVELPPEQRSPEAIAAAKEDAARKAGGSLDKAPAAAEGSAASLAEQAATAAQVAQESKAASTDCASKVQYSANWAAKLPAALAVYPRGAVQESAGTDADGCALRAVSFVTPVETGDVIDFYYTQVRKAGYGADVRKDGNDTVLGGKKGSSAYVIYARKLDNGLTEVDLVSSGK
ncbi:MAG TPA: hypothetical protein VJM34_13020 [Novosphingobium sp.]|nr:hypothetical protein [Novosphingobium sp.]